MNLQQGGYHSSSANGFVRHKVESGGRVENILQSGKSNSYGVFGSGVSKVPGFECLSRDRLVYLTTCLIGLHVDVQVKSGSMYSGIFHATNADRDFGIILKLARLTKDVSFRGQNSGFDSASKAPTKILIIPAHELVQVVAKDVPVTRDGSSNELQGESQQDIMLDSYISQSRQVDVGRELEPWLPDDDASQCPELENIFDSPWTGRSWDQFKVNETLFGVKSTFDEELYTTKLEKGPRMREREAEARRIAREIEGEETYDLHLAEERGAFPDGNFDLDEETKYSSVFRGFDDSGCADEDVILNSHNMETFGDSSGPDFIRSFADVTGGKSGKCLEVGGLSSGLLSKELCSSISQTLDSSANAVCGFKDADRIQENHINEPGGNQYMETSRATVQTAKSDDLHPLSVSKRDGSEKGGVSSVLMTSSTVCTKIEEKTSSSDLSENKAAKEYFTERTYSHGRQGSYTSSTSESEAATSPPSATALSPSSSVGSLSSEKSTLNPNAKEFRLNPKAKSFAPLPSLLRPVSPVNDASFYFPSTTSAVPHMHGMAVGIGAGQSFAGHQPVLFNPHAAAMQSQQAYYPANGPQYGQQMILGHPRQVMYMPGYPTGREY